MILSQSDVGKTVFHVDGLAGRVLKATIVSIFPNNAALLSAPCSGGFVVNGSELSDNENDAVAPLFALCR